MSAAWVAGTVRGRLMLERRLGAVAAADVAGAGSLQQAAAALAGTIYSRAAGAASLEAAQREVAASLVLNLRVLAAWLPSDGAGLLRALAGWFEIANVEDRLGYLAGGPLRSPFTLGVLSSAWEGLAQAQDPGEMRRILSASSWGDPHGDRPDDLLLGMRLGWLRRVVRQAPEVISWALGAGALVLAGEVFLAGREPASLPVDGTSLGGARLGADSVPELRRRLPAAASWALAGIDEPEQLWRAELSWWKQVGQEAETMIRSGRHGRGVIVGVAALLALDAARASAALLAATGPASSPAAEVLDALC